MPLVLSIQDGKFLVIYGERCMSFNTVAEHREFATSFLERVTLTTIN